MRIFDQINSGTPPRTEGYEKESIQTEDSLESLLNRNPEVLLDEPVFIFGRQYPLDGDIPDLLALDQYGNTIVFELKIGKSGTGSASEETILGQPQVYAQALHSYDYAQLNKIYQSYCSGVDQDRWDVPEDMVPADELSEAYESVFGISLEADEFNEDQRMVIVAEEITGQTDRNARYLLEKGLNIQCVEVQRFHKNSEHRVLATNTVVDYELSRVRPDRKANPTYPNVVSDLIERTFPKVRPLIEIGAPSMAFENTDSYRPRLRSNHPDHPKDLKYVFYLRPVAWGSIVVAIDFMGQDESTLATLRDNAELFEERGFKVSPDRSRDRIIRTSWEVNSAEILDDAAFLDEIAERFITLVETGHEVFSDD